MASVTLYTLEDLMPQVERVLALAVAKIVVLIPDAKPEHIGATAIPGALTKGDVDVLLQVPADRFQATVDALRWHFTIKQPENWTPEFASFGDDTSYDLPLGIQVVVEGSSMDFLIFLRDHFRSHRDALNEYNRLKMIHAPEGPEGYWKAKDRFLTEILASR